MQLRTLDGWQWVKRVNEPSPRDVSPAPHSPDVEGIVAAHASDPRVAFWELQNEPVNATWWSSLRDAAFGWARALHPRAPVISCWLDNIDTELVDVHVYSELFASMWVPRIFTNASKGALITEGGGRWTEPPVEKAAEDQGSPLAALNFLAALRVEALQGRVPFMPGVLLGWETHTGNSNSRWYWAAREGMPEPHIPWLGFLWPDGTPVSHSEAAALRAYAGGHDEFLAFNKWLSPVVRDGAAFLTLAPGAMFSSTAVGGGPLAFADAVVEAALWLEKGGVASVTVRSHPAAPNSSRLTTPSPDGYAVRVDADAKELWVERVSGGSAAPLGERFDLSTRENGVGVDCFNLLRVVIHGDNGGHGTTVHVWFNVLFSDAGFVGDASDAERVPLPPAALISVSDPVSLPPGGLSVTASGAELRVDYLTALPTSVLP